MPSGMIHISFIEPSTGVEVSIESEMSQSEFREELEVCKLMAKSMSVKCGDGQLAVIPLNVLEHSIIIVA